VVHHQSLDVLEVLEGMRRSYWLHLPPDRPTMNHLISHVLDDVISAGATSVTVLRSGAFACVQAEIDWLAKPGLSVPELFSRIVPNGRVNSHRSEIMLAAFADGYVSTGEAGPIQGGLPSQQIPAAFLAQTTKPGRCLVWRSSGFVPPPNATERPPRDGA
jgi:hypothetical protein